MKETEAAKEQLVAIAIELSILGEQVELARMAIHHLVDQGSALSSPEVVSANNFFSKLSAQFLALEEEYEALKAAVVTDKNS